MLHGEGCATAQEAAIRLAKFKAAPHDIVKKTRNVLREAARCVHLTVPGPPVRAVTCALARVPQGTVKQGPKSVTVFQPRSERSGDG